jgi:hypothetical protein
MAINMAQCEAHIKIALIQLRPYASHTATDHFRDGCMDTSERFDP